MFIVTSFMGISFKVFLSSLLSHLSLVSAGRQLGAGSPHLPWDVSASGIYSRVPRPSLATISSCVTSRNGSLNMKPGESKHEAMSVVSASFSIQDYRD